MSRSLMGAKVRLDCVVLVANSLAIDSFPVLPAPLLELTLLMPTYEMRSSL